MIVVLFFSVQNILNFTYKKVFFNFGLIFSVSVARIFI